MSKNEEITFLSFTAKYSKDVIHEVAVDLEERNYRIETTDLEGRMIQEAIDGRLRRSRVRKYLEGLKALDIASWPLVEESIMESFPTEIDHLAVWYTYDEESKGFETQGRTTKDLVKIHQLTEELISRTFGSYAFYEE